MNNQFLRPVDLKFGTYHQFSAFIYFDKRKNLFLFE